MIRFSAGGVSRADLARYMDLTRAAITAIINDLISEGLVCETEQSLDIDHTTSGRRPILLEMNPQHSNIIGIDMGSTHVSVIISDFSSHILSEVESPFDIRKSPLSCLETVDRLVRQILEQSKVQLSNVLAIGIAVPGPVDASLGGVSAPPIMPGWDGFPIRDTLQEMWKLPVAVGNDAEFGALGEWAYGAGRGERNLAYIKVGSGIGAGLLFNGKIYNGATGSAGEIGHITIQENGPLCSCGNYGCLESLSGGNAIAQRAREAVQAGRRTQLALVDPIGEITARHVAEAARQGDLVAQQIIASSGSHLGVAIASLVNLFNPGMVVIGGGVALLGDLLLDPVRQAVRERSLRSAAQAVRISTAVLGRRSTSIGAVVQAVDLALDRLTGR